VSDRAAQPDDGVVVYRAKHADSLRQACELILNAGIPAVWHWREFQSARYSGGRDQFGEGEVVVPAGSFEKSRSLLVAWEAETQGRIREHLKDLPRQLRRVALIAGLCLFGIMALTGEAWRRAPAVMWLMGGAIAVLLLWEVPALLRARRERAERERVAPVQPPRWFER
jgi:hypothetical protein